MELDQIYFCQVSRLVFHNKISEDQIYFREVVTGRDAAAFRLDTANEVKLWFFFHTSIKI